VLSLPQVWRSPRFSQEMTISAGALARLGAAPRLLLSTQAIGGTITPGGAAFGDLAVAVEGRVTAVPPSTASLCSAAPTSLLCHRPFVTVLASSAPARSVSSASRAEISPHCVTITIGCRWLRFSGFVPVSFCPCDGEGFRCPPLYALLRRGRTTGPPMHKGLHLFLRHLAILVLIHRLENSRMGRLKLLQ
jgi:hypothetical protein